MKFFHYRELCAQSFVILSILFLSLDLNAQQYRLQTDTVAKATQLVRSDLTIAAQRPFSQTLSLWGYNLAGPYNKTLNVHLQLNYFNDFAADTQRNDVYLSHRFNRISITQAWIQWKPFKRIDLKLGRLVNRSIFHAKDVDGASVSLSFGDKTRWKTSLYGGRHVTGRPESLDPDQYDIQGRPIELRQNNDRSEFIYGLRSRLSFQGGSGSIGYEKRFTSSSISDERIAATLTGNPTQRTIVSGLMSFHTPSRTLNRGQLNFTWRPNDFFYLRQGFEHIIPIFDASSIFNLFGVAPSQSLTSTAWLGNNERGLEARLWAKSLQEDLNTSDLGSSSTDLRTFGFAIRYNERLNLFGRALRLSPSISFQPGDSQGYSRDQFISRLNARFPLDSVKVLAGSTLLWVGSDIREDSQFVFTHRLGLDFPTSFGVFSLGGVVQTSQYLGNHLSLFGTFETELWL